MGCGSPAGSRACVSVSTHPSPFSEILSPDLPKLSARHKAMLDRLRVVLVEPHHPGNIGSVARAMNVCGLDHLYLVNPAPWRESDEAWRLACGSRKVLNAAVEVSTLEGALDGVLTAIGTTHRMGRARGPMVPPRILAEHLPSMLDDGAVAIVFGREDKGLSNEELARCQMGVHIPTAGSYPSLNLSHAVMVVAYECYYGVLTSEEQKNALSEPSYPAIVALAERLARLTERTGFAHRRGRVGLERSLRQAITRSDLSQRDLALVHLLCRHLERYVGGLERGLPPEEARQAPFESASDPQG